jgi:hypothetical protein
MRARVRKLAKVTAAQAEIPGDILQVAVNLAPGHHIELVFDETILVPPFALGVHGGHDLIIY